MMNWTFILAIVIAVVVLIILYRKLSTRRKIGANMFGYFVNQQYLGAIFPQTGDPVMLADNNGRRIISTTDNLGKLTPKPFPEFEGRFIIVQDLIAAPTAETSSISEIKTSRNSDLILYACSVSTEIIDVSKTPRIYAALDDETKMPIIKLGDVNSAGTVWKFTPVIVKSTDMIRKFLGMSSAKGNIFTEMPDKFPSWVATNAKFTNVMKAGGSFTAMLKNLKYPELQYPQAIVTMKRWGKVGIMIVDENKGVTVDPQVLLVPTTTNMVFRVFSMQTAVPNKETGQMENYTQLVAANGASYNFSKTIVDTDTARWTLVLAK